MELDPHDTRTLGDRGWNYYYLKEYQQAIDDFEHALELNPNDTRAHSGRGHIYEILKEYKQALAHFERIIEVTPTDTHGYYMRGQVYMHLKEYRRAIANFDYALELDPNSAFSLYRRGYVYLWLKDMKQAGADFTRNWELDPTVSYGWMAEWVSMCQRGASPHTLDRLEELIAVATPSTRYYPRARYYPHVFQGVVLLLRERYEEAITELEQAISWEAELGDAYFWKGMACVSFGHEKEAMEMIEKSLELELPPVLLSPLRRFEQDRPDFYQKFVVPLFARYELPG